MSWWDWHRLGRFAGCFACLCAVLVIVGSAQGATLTEFPAPSSNPAGITAGPDGALWFTEAGSNQIGRITTGGVVTNEYTLPSGSEPGDIDAGPDGRLWFTEALSSKIGAITTAGTITHYSLPAGSDPSGITVLGA